MFAEHSSLWQLSSSYLPELKLSSVIDFVLLTCPYLLPPIVVFALEGPLSLRTWLAIQGTPLHIKNSSSSLTARDEHVSAEHIRRRFLTYVAPTYLLVITLFGAFLQCGIHASTRTMKVFDSITLAPLFIYATSQFFVLCSGMYTLRVFRDAEGDPYLSQSLRPYVPKALSIIPFLAGLGVSLCAIIARDAICQSIVHAALLHVVIMNDVISTKSFRSMIFYAGANVLTLLGIGLFFASHPASLRLMLRFGSEHPETVDANHWPLFALAVLWNVFPVELVILCFRFDYTRAQERAEELAVVVHDANSRLPISRRSSSCDANGKWNQDVPLTHDMLLSGMAGEDKEVEGAGPIFLGPSDPDAFYSSEESFKFKDDEESAELELPIPISSPDTLPGTPLPSSLRLQKRAEFPHTAIAVLVFLYASGTFLYLLSHVSVLIRIPGMQHASLVWYGAPLLPLATFPLMVLAVFLVRGGEAGEVWRYQEVWGTEEGDGEIRLRGEAAA